MHLQEEIEPDELNLTIFTFLDQKLTFWHNFSALPLWHVNLTWLSL